MAVRKIKILPDGVRVVFAEVEKAARLVKEGRAEYVEQPPKPKSNARVSRAQAGD